MQLMIKKLQSAESDYRVHDILRDTDNYLVYRHNIMSSTKTTASIYDASLYSSIGKRPFSAKSRPASAPKRIY